MTPQMDSDSARSSMAPDGAEGDRLFQKLQSALAGQFTIERVLGRGGMGLVYLAREIRLDRLVAIKVLPPALADDPVVRERFLREARTAAMLSHPNIVPIYRVDELGGLVFFVMAYVDGPTLGARVRRSGPVPSTDVAKILRDVAWALAYAHAHGVVHCDVKPDNILLDQATGRALVTDFGIARDVRGRSGEKAGPVVGTAHFMSPEQLTGVSLDARSDIYSLGIVGWYAVSGQLPFDGPVHVVLHKHAHEPPPVLKDVAPHVPRALADTLQHALEKSPDDRYQTAESFADAIALSVAPELVASIPVRVWLAGGDDLRYVLAAAFGAAGLAVSHRGPWTEMLAYVIATLLAFVLLELSDVRRLLAAGYDLHYLRAALRLELDKASSAVAAHAARSRGSFRGSRQATLQSVGVFVIGVALALMGVVALSVGRFSSHALGVGIAGLGILAMSRGHAVGHDWVTSVRARLWCSRAGAVLAALAAWRAPSSGEPSVSSALQFVRDGAETVSTPPLEPEAVTGTSRDEVRTLRSVIDHLEWAAAALRLQLRETEGSLAAGRDGRHDDAHMTERQLALKAAELERIQRRLAALQAEVAAVGDVRPELHQSSA